MIEPALHAVGTVTLSPGMSTQEILLRCRPRDTKHVYPVADLRGRVLGLVTHDELASLESSRDLAGVTTASKLMRPLVAVAPDDDLSRALELMLTSGLRELPVIARLGSHARRGGRPNLHARLPAPRPAISARCCLGEHEVAPRVLARITAFTRRDAFDAA